MGRKVEMLRDLIDESIDEADGEWQEDAVSVNQRARAVSVKGIKVASRWFKVGLHMFGQEDRRAISDVVGNIS